MCLEGKPHWITEWSIRRQGITLSCRRCTVPVGLEISKTGFQVVEQIDFLAALRTIDVQQLAVVKMAHLLRRVPGTVTTEVYLHLDLTRYPDSFQTRMEKVLLFWSWLCSDPVNHPPGGKWGSQVGEAICSCVFFWARTAGSKLHILWLTIVLKLLFPGDDGGRCRAAHLARVKDQDVTIGLQAQTINQEKQDLVTVVSYSSCNVHDCCVLPVLPPWVHRVRTVPIFCSAVHVTLSIGAVVITSTLRVGPRTHDDRRNQLGFTILTKYTTCQNTCTETSNSPSTQRQCPHERLCQNPFKNDSSATIWWYTRPKKTKTRTCHCNKMINVPFNFIYVTNHIFTASVQI